jgi:hypothetical protein
MRRVAGLLVAAGVVLALPGCVAPPPEAGPPASLPSGRPELAAESARQRAAEVTMRVRNRSCDGVATGSGFAVGPRRLVTNRHVVEGRRSCSSTPGTAGRSRSPSIGLPTCTTWRSSRRWSRCPGWRSWRPTTPSRERG